MDIEKLKHTLFNVNHICTHIAYSRTAVKQISFNEHTQVYTDVHRLLDIYICSLLDELIVFEKFVAEEDNYYLSDTLYVLLPLIDYIKKFDSLRVKRNKLLAHHNRDRKKSVCAMVERIEREKICNNKRRRKHDIQYDKMYSSNI